MRIVFVVDVFPPEPEPAAVMASELTRQWSMEGRTVTVICPFPNRPYGKIYEGFSRLPWHTTETANLRIIRVWTWFVGRKRRYLSRLLENLSFGVTSGLALLSIRKPDLVIYEAWPIVAQLAIVMVCRIRKLRVVNYVQDLFPEAAVAAGFLRPAGLFETLLLRLDRKSCNAVSCNVVISEKMKAALTSTRDVASNKVYVIQNWIDVQMIRPFAGTNKWREEQGIPSDDLLFVYAGAMGFASRVDVLLEVADKLKDTRGIRIVCVGEGPFKEILIREQIKRKMRNLMILGFQPRDRVSEMLSCADVMLLITSQKMGISSVPSKLITYLAVGKPVLCSVSEDSDIADLVKSNDIGLVVPPGDPMKICEGILELASIDRVELNQKGLKARDLAVRVFSLPRALRDFEDLFDATMGRNIRV
jgi:colanic acid biosynthesis glycosyl transferase WcaI